MKRLAKVGIAAALVASCFGCAAWTSAHDRALAYNYQCDVCDRIDRYIVHIGNGSFCNGCAENLNEMDYATVEKFEEIRGSQKFTDGFKEFIEDYESPVWCDSCGEVYEESEMKYLPYFKSEDGFEGWFCPDCYDRFNI